jgi:hypothetical protein
VLLGKISFKDLIGLLNISMLLPTKFVAVAHLTKGHFLRVTEYWARFLILQEGTLRLILLSKEGQNLDPERT